MITQKVSDATNPKRQHEESTGGAEEDRPVTRTKHHMKINIPSTVG